MGLVAGPQGRKVGEECRQLWACIFGVIFWGAWSPREKQGRRIRGKNSPKNIEEGRSTRNGYEASKLGEGKWGRKKCRRIPMCEGDWQGRVPMCSLHRKTLQNKGFGAPNF